MTGRSGRVFVISDTSADSRQFTRGIDERSLDGRWKGGGRITNAGAWKKEKQQRWTSIRHRRRPDIVSSVSKAVINLTGSRPP